MDIKLIKKILDKAVQIGAPLAPTVVDVAKSIGKAFSKKVEARPWNRQHLWQEFTANADIVHTRVDKPYCFTCKVERTPANQNEICPGPPGWK